LRGADVLGLVVAGRHVRPRGRRVHELAT
jgi:hypothetical protein